MRNLRYVALVLLVAVLGACKAQPKASGITTTTGNNSLLWKISGNGAKAESFLYGTFHILCKDDIVFGKNVTPALRYADEVYFEMDLDDPSVLLGAMLFMNMKGDSTLAQFYTAEQYKKITDYFSQQAGMPMAMLQRMKPAMIESLLYPAFMACKNASGVEQELLKIAAANNKEVKGFETIKEQSAVFDVIPYSVQAKSLYKTIDSLDSYKKQFAEMVQAYKNEAIDSLADTIEGDDSGMGDYTDVLLTNRNKNWVKQLSVILPKQNIFIAVGAGHLGGKNGLIALLRQAGYKVEPVSR